VALFSLACLSLGHSLGACPACLASSQLPLAASQPAQRQSSPKSPAGEQISKTAKPLQPAAHNQRPLSLTLLLLLLLACRLLATGPPPNSLLGRSISDNGQQLNGRPDGSSRQSIIITKRRKGGENKNNNNNNRRPSGGTTSSWATLTHSHFVALLVAALSSVRPSVQRPSGSPAQCSAPLALQARQRGTQIGAKLRQQAPVLQARRQCRVHNAKRAIFQGRALATVCGRSQAAVCSVQCAAAP